MSIKPPLSGSGPDGVQQTCLRIAPMKHGRAELIERAVALIMEAGKE